jgi:hypothetical protein
MSYATELAKELKSRDNQIKIGVQIGDVLSISPLKIGIMNNKVIIDEKICYLCSHIVENYSRKATEEIKEYVINIATTDKNMDGEVTPLDVDTQMAVETKTDYDTVITFKDILHIGDKVLLIPTEDNQIYFVVDKVVL